MPPLNIRFSHYPTHASLFELEVEPGTRNKALKAMVEQHLINNEGLLMRYFDRWLTEKRDPINDEGQLEDEAIVLLDGPIFEEGQAEVGKAMAVMRQAFQEQMQTLQTQQAAMAAALANQTQLTQQLMADIQTLKANATAPAPAA